MNTLQPARPGTTYPLNESWGQNLATRAALGYDVQGPAADDQPAQLSMFGK